MADRLARLGTGTNRYGPALLVPVPVTASFTRSILTRWAMNRHQRYWTNIDGHRQSKMAVPKVNMSTWNAVKNLTRKQMRVSTHMLTGHNVLRYHLCNMEKSDSPICEQCDDEVREDALHFLGRCPAFSTIRYSIFRFQFLNEDQIKDLNIQKILTFVRRTERYIDC